MLTHLKAKYLDTLETGTKTAPVLETGTNKLGNFFFHVNLLFRYSFYLSRWKIVTMIVLIRHI